MSDDAPTADEYHREMQRLYELRRGDRADDNDGGTVTGIKGIETVETDFGNLNAKGYYTAKAVARFELGDAAWADEILRAYFKPNAHEHGEAIEAWEDSHRCPATS
jgi:hypothetical protein